MIPGDWTLVMKRLDELVEAARTEGSVGFPAALDYAQAVAEARDALLQTLGLPTTRMGVAARRPEEGSKYEAALQQAKEWITRGLAEERPYDCYTHLLALVETEAAEQGRHPSSAQACHVLNVRGLVRDGLLQREEELKAVTRRIERGQAAAKLEQTQDLLLGQIAVNQNQEAVLRSVGAEKRPRLMRRISNDVSEALNHLIERAREAGANAQRYGGVETRAEDWGQVIAARDKVVALVSEPLPLTDAPKMEALRVLRDWLSAMIDAGQTPTVMRPRMESEERG